MIGEFQLIDKLTSGWRLNREVAIGPGDDASAIAIQKLGGDLYLQTMDLLTEDIHFRRGWGTPFQLGWKSLAVNLSDIAAMGGLPLHTHLALAIPVSWSEAEILEFQSGFHALAEQYKVSLLGGDVTASKKGLMIAVTAGGIVSKDQVIKRDGAKPGDLVWVSGCLGDAAAGLMALQKHVSDPRLTTLLAAFLQPLPEIELGRLCAESKLAHSMIDLSDGLTGDLGHILRASGVGAILYEEKLPISSELITAIDVYPWNLSYFCLRGGEDYLLLGTSSKAEFKKLQELAGEKLLKRIYPIGEITAASGLRLQCSNGKSKDLIPKSYDHFIKSKYRSI